jgi:hypothetical protein
MAQHIAHRRQYERHTIDLRVELVVSEPHASQVSPVGGASIQGRMKNISGGGALVVVPTYLPRATQVELEIPPGSAVPAGRLAACVTKVQMVDREPRYGLGLRFEDTECDLVRALQAWGGEEAGK